MFETESGLCEGEDTPVWTLLVDGKMQGETHRDMTRMENDDNEFKETSPPGDATELRIRGRGPGEEGSNTYMTLERWECEM